MTLAKRGHDRSQRVLHALAYALPGFRAESTTLLSKSGLVVEKLPL